MRDSSKGKAIVQVSSDEFDLIMGDPLDSIFVFDRNLFLVELDDCILFHF